MMGKEYSDVKSKKNTEKKNTNVKKKPKVLIITAVVAAVVILVAAIAIISSSGSDEIPENASTIQAFYSTKSLEGDFIVQVQNFSSEPYATLYDPDGLYVKFKDGEKIYDQEGNELSRDDLVPGDTLEIYYTGELTKNNPKTITVYKIVKIVH